MYLWRDRERDLKLEHLQTQESCLLTRLRREQQKADSHLSVRRAYEAFERHEQKIRQFHPDLHPFAAGSDFTRDLRSDVGEHQSAVEGRRRRMGGVGRVTGAAEVSQALVSRRVNGSK